MRKPEESITSSPNTPNDDISVPNIQLADFRHVGVKGWLLLLCISLAILTPVVFAVTIFNDYRAIGPFATPEGLWMLRHLQCCVYTMLTVFSIFAGARLWTLRRGARVHGENLSCLFLLATLAAIWLPLLPDLTQQQQAFFIGESIKVFLCSCIFSIIGFSYLCVSKRVRATYPKR